MRNSLLKASEDVVDVYVTSSKHLARELNSPKKLCKPSTPSLVCITVLNSPINHLYLSSFLDEATSMYARVEKSSIEKITLTRSDIACVAGRRKGGRKVKMSAEGNGALHAHLSPFPTLPTPATQALV